MMTEEPMMTGDWRRWLKVFALLVGLPASLVAEPVDLQVSGTGWLENRRLERSLDRLRPDPEAPKLDANGVEDAVFFLFSALADDGYLKPAVTVELTRPNGERLTHTFDASLTNLLPRPLEAVRVNFQIERGVRYRFGEITVTGNTGKRSPEEVRALVLPEATGFGFGGDYAYSPPALRRGLNRVVDTLALEGHAQARAEAPRVTMDDASGEVTISVEVQAGPQSWVDEIVVTGDHPTDLRWPGLDEREQQPWSFAWEQDAMEILRHSLYQRGYPDVRIRSSRVERPGAEGRRLARVTFSIVTGPRVVVKDVRFAGEHGVKESVLRRRVRTEPGEPLDPLRFEAARYRLARLGAFRRVELDYEPATGPERSPVFTLSPLPLWE
ncbi:MAG TPA: POTRA domain-containing protein, partial [Candidatus Synoicihabitans sp.]|nr:POTRA domain-containing protein [Candidatus Synoicihabitans sp.]